MLCLNGLIMLTESAAKALAGYKGKELSLSGLTTLTEPVAKALVG